MSKLSNFSPPYIVCEQCGNTLRKPTDIVRIVSEINTPLSDSVPYESFTLCRECYKEFTKWIGVNLDE